MNTMMNQAPCGTLSLPLEGRLPASGAELSALERRGRCLRSAAMFAAARALVRLLAGGLRSLRRGLSRWNVQRRAIAQLSRLDDHLLSDIGMRREEIPLVVDGLARRSGAHQVATIRRHGLPELAVTRTRTGTIGAVNDDQCPPRAA